MKRLVLALISLIAAAQVEAADPAPTVKFEQGDHKVDVLIGDRLFTSYLYADTLPKPVLYPVHTLAGVMVCRTYPPGKDESQDHPHHGGIFFACDRVNGNSFWLNTSRSPHIEHVRFTQKKTGPGEGRLSAVLRWVAKDGAVLLQENRDMVFRVAKEGYSIDLNIDLVAQKEKVVFADTKEGVLAIRVADWMREEFKAERGVVGISGSGSGNYLSAAGGEKEKGVWGHRADWVRLEASRDGKDVGVAIFDHPSSINHPTYWHARGYGLFAANPLGRGVFEAAHNPGKGEPLDLTLMPGEKAHFRYLVLVYDGRKTSADLTGLYKAFAH
jgi:hypothetical protein